jgi:GNAT superfamily N-acetyltransferase
MDRKGELKSLWKEVFGDTDEYIERFFGEYYSPELCVYSVRDGRTAAAAYLMPAGDFMQPDGGSVPCAHIYAVGVLPEYRGLGLGKDVTERCAMLGLERGFGAVILHPADEGLFRFYKSLGFYTSFYESPCLKPPGRGLLPIAAGEYRSLRETYLQGTAHVNLDIKALEYFESQGGQFFKGENFCMAKDDGVVKEYLYPGFAPPEDGIPFGMSYGKKLCTGGWLGLAFD